MYYLNVVISFNTLKMKINQSQKDTDVQCVGNKAEKGRHVTNARDVT